MSIVDGRLTSGGGKCEPWLLDRSRALLGSEWWSVWTVSVGLLEKSLHDVGMESCLCNENHRFWDRLVRNARRIIRSEWRLEVSNT